MMLPENGRSHGSSGQIALKPAPPRPGRNNRTILVIDDEEGIRYVVSQILEREGFCVVTACDGWEGIERFRELRDEIVLVFLDMVMPNLDGETTYHALRELQKDVKVLICSGYVTKEVAMRFLDIRTTDFIQKPFNRTGLLNKIHALLAMDEHGFEAGI